MLQNKVPFSVWMDWFFFFLVSSRKFWHLAKRIGQLANSQQDNSLWGSSMQDNSREEQAELQLTSASWTSNFRRFKPKARRFSSPVPLLSYHALKCPTASTSAVNCLTANPPGWVDQCKMAEANQPGWVSCGKLS